MTAPHIEDRKVTFAAGMAATLLCMLFGANAVAIKISLSGIGVFTTAGIRFSLAAAAIFCWTRITGRTLGFERRLSGRMLLIAAFFTVQLSLFYLGVSRSNASRATLLVNLQPFFVLLLAHFFIPGDRITPRKALGMLTGFMGVVFVFMEKKGVANPFQGGDAIILSTTFIWAVNAVIIKRMMRWFRPFQVVFYPMVVAAPIFFLEGMYWDRAMIFDLRGEVLLAMGYQIFVTASFGFVAWTAMVKKYGAVAMHSFIFVMPVSGVILGGLLLKEPITYKIVIALVLIATGILVSHFKQHGEVTPLPMGKNI